MKQKKKKSKFYAQVVLDNVPVQKRINGLHTENQQIFTCVPLPEPGGPRSMALMPGSLPSSSG